MLDAVVFARQADASLMMMMIMMMMMMMMMYLFEGDGRGGGGLLVASAFRPFFSPRIPSVPVQTGILRWP